MYRLFLFRLQTKIPQPPKIYHAQTRYFTKKPVSSATCQPGCDLTNPDAILHFMPDSAKLSSTLPASSLEHSERQFEALLAVSETISQQHELKLLFHDLSERLHTVLSFDFLALVLHDPARNTMRLHTLETREPLDKEHHKEFPIENHPQVGCGRTSVHSSASIQRKDARYPEFMQRLLEVGVHSFAIVPLTTAQHRLGAMSIGRYVPHGMGDAELDFIERVAKQVAVAVDNAINFEAAQAYQAQLARERDRLQVLLDINNLLVSTRDTNALFRGIVSSLKPVLHHDYTSLALLDDASGLLKIHALDLNGGVTKIPKSEYTVSLEDSPSGQCFSTGQVLIVRGAELDAYKPEVIPIYAKRVWKYFAAFHFPPTAARSAPSIWPAAILSLFPIRCGVASTGGYSGGDRTGKRSGLQGN